MKTLLGGLLALDIRRCLHYVGKITGEITHEDQLDYMLSSFISGTIALFLFHDSPICEIFAWCISGDTSKINHEII